MQLSFRFLLMIGLLTASLLISGCESSEQRAEGYYKSGMALLAAGDEERALVEFRNVFKYNGFHKEARKTYADIQLKRGETGEAYSQYLLLIEQYPDTVEVRKILAEIAIGRGDWEEAERHGRAAFAIAPGVPAIKAINAALDYRKGQEDENETLQKTAIATAKDVLTMVPDSIVARRVVIESLLSGPTPSLAMPEIDAAISYAPDELELHILKLQLLIDDGKVADTGKQLQTMAERFPANERVRAGLVSWYLEQNDVDGAETFLRGLAAKAGDATGPQMNVVRLLQETRGADAAKAELDTLIAANKGKPAADIYRALRASIDFENGRQPDALTAMEEILKSAPASEQTRTIKIMMAKMLELSGNSVGARARVEEILAEDVSNIEALKMRATWLIEEDKPGDAIVALRTALDQNPRDSSVLTLMATAHDRDGSPELAAERLALAVEVSGAAPDESLRYASFLLLTNNDLAAARSVLQDALAASPVNLDIVRALAEVLVQQREWSRAQELVNSLRSMHGPEAARTADGITAAILLGQEKTDESIGFLQGMIDKGDGDVSSIAMIIQTQIRAGKTSEARSYLDQALIKSPDNVGLRFLSGNLYALMGDVKPAEAIFRALIDEDPEAEPAMRALYALLKEGKRPDEASTLLDTFIERRPESVTLRWMKATELEGKGDIDGAIAIYETLYAEDSSDPVVANNLASLITSYRDDPQGLERAYAVARRLRGNPTPAFQDTYGWIEFRRGNFEEAARSLVPAAIGLPDDPLVQLHVGLAYEAVGQLKEAKAALERALDMAGDSTLPAFQSGRDALARLNAPASTEPAKAP